MIDQLLALIVDESKWLPASMAGALLALAAGHFRHRRLEFSVRRRVLAAMSLFFGVTIGIMACGHLLAVTTKLATGALQGSAPLLYAIGVALAVPAWWLAALGWRMMAAAVDPGRATAGLNAWLTLTLLALGVHNLPLAVPGLLNLGYYLHSRRAVGWVIVGLAVIVQAGLFAGSVMFFLSGQSFEEFRGLD